MNWKRRMITEASLYSLDVRRVGRKLNQDLKEISLFSGGQCWSLMKMSECMAVICRSLSLAGLSCVLLVDCCLEADGKEESEIYWVNAEDYKEEEEEENI